MCYYVLIILYFMLFFCNIRGTKWIFDMVACKRGRYCMYFCRIIGRTDVTWSSSSPCLIKGVFFSHLDHIFKPQFLTRRLIIDRTFSSLSFFFLNQLKDGMFEAVGSWFEHAIFSPGFLATLSPGFSPGLLVMRIPFSIDQHHDEMQCLHYIHTLYG